MKTIMSSCQHKGYNTKIKFFNENNIELTYYSSPLRIKTENNEVIPIIKQTKKTDRKKRCSTEVYSKRNLRKSADKLYGYVMANKDLWHTFITLTFANTITDIKDANYKFHSWQVSIIQKNKDFKYIGVPEFQKNGRVHYHLLTNIEFNSEFVFPALNDKGKQIQTYNNKKKKSYYVWNIKYWKHGFSTVLNLDSTDNHFNIASYMAKYLFKDFDKRLFGHQKVMVSKGLKFYDMIYSYEEVYDKLELELGMTYNGYSKFSEKFISVENPNKYMPSTMTIMKFEKTHIEDDEMELFNDYIESLIMEIDDIKNHRNS